MNRRWILACATAEALGIAASASAARAAGATGVVVGFLLVVAGGLVEGTALGLAQARVLGDRLPRARPWVLATVLVAGLGWVAGSAPAALSSDSDAAAPPLGLIVLGAAGLGLVMGALLGAAQSLVLRSLVSHPWRWVTANALGWTVAMPVIFAGASTAGASWSWPVLVGFGAVTGAAAGAGLGLVTGAWLPTLQGPPVRHRLVLRWLSWRGTGARAGWTALTVTGAQSGRMFSFPVMAAPLGQRSLVVLPGHPERRSWWHNLRPGSEVGVLDHGQWAPARARLLQHGSLDWSVARSVYVARWPHARVGTGPLVVLDLRRAPVQHQEDESAADRDPVPLEPRPDRRPERPALTRTAST